jgi:hypothetical protein
MTLVEIRAALEESNFDLPDGVNKKESPPKHIKWVPRLRRDILALTELFSSKTPPRRQVRPTKSAVAVYQFGDDSGFGFGSSLMIADTIYYQHGQWSFDHAAESSNYRELANLIYAIEKAHEKGLLEDTELFFYIDNMTAESVFYKGTSH